MGRYRRSYVAEEAQKRPWEIHPIWRGIGCIFMLLIPVMSFAGAYILVRENFQQRWIAVPAELSVTFVIPFLGTRLYVADIMGTVVLMVIGFGLMTIVYALIYRLIGPSQYGPLDAPPPKRRKKNR